MTPSALLVSLLCSWALTNWWLLPLSKTKWEAAGMRQKLAKAGTVAVIEKVRDLSAAGSVAVSAFLLTMWIAEWVSGSAVTVPAAVLATAQGLYVTVKDLKEGYGSALGWLGLAGAAAALYLTARHARARVLQAWSSKAGEVHRELQSDTRAVLARAAADPELAPAAERAAAIIGLLLAQDQSPDGVGSSAESNASRLGEKAVAALHEELSVLLTTLSIELSERELDLKAALGARSDDEPRPRTGWQRVFHAVISDRFAKDLGLARKPLGYVAMGLLFISLLGWSAQDIEPGLRIALNRLEVNASARSNAHAVDDAFTQADLPPPVSQSSPDSRSNSQQLQAATRLVANSIARGMLTAGRLHEFTGTPQATHDTSEFVRAAIAGFEPAAPVEDSGPAADAAKVRREVAQAPVSDPPDTPALVAHIEQRVEPHLAKLQEEKPHRFQELLATLERRYSGPMHPMDAQSKLMGQIVEEAFSELKTATSNEIGTQAQKLAKDFGEEAVKTWADSLIDGLLHDAIMAPAKAQLEAEGRTQFGFRTTEQSRAFVESLRDAEGRAWSSSPKAREEARMYASVADAVARQDPAADPTLLASLRERLGGYDAVFPSERPAAPPIPDAPLPSGGFGGERRVAANGSRGSGFHMGSSPRPWSSSVRVAMASARVRGVLVGQDHPSQLDVSDIRWQAASPLASGEHRIALELRLDGRWITAGTFRAGVVNQALRYAADTRVVATTIMPGAGPVTRVTYLHPVLADTPLGCRIVEADRFVDTFSATELPPAPPLTRLWQDRGQMRHWLVGVDLTRRIVAQNPASCPVQQVRELAARVGLGQIQFSQEMQSTLRRFLADDKVTGAASTALLEIGTSCTSGKEDVAGCLCSKAGSLSQSTKYWVPVDHTSQLREKETTLDRDLAWLRPSPNHLAHVDFWVHTTFAAQRPDEDPDLATTRPMDFPPTELASLRTELASRLPAYVKGSLNSGYDDFMGPVEEFVLVQRLARAGLDGRLGASFPAQKLIALERQTRPYVPAQPTIKWDARQGREELLSTLKAAGTGADKAYVRWESDQLQRFIGKRPVCDPASR